MRNRSIRRTCCALACCALMGSLMLAASGCNVIGVIAAKMPRPPVKAEHSIAGASVGVMVWADRGTLLDFPNIQLDLAGSIQARFLDVRKADEKFKDLQGTTFPHIPASIIKWQRDNPGFDAEPVTDIAPRLGVNKLIYVEVARLGTRAADAIALYRGTAIASLKVIEVVDGKGKVVYDVPDLRVAYPPDGNEDGSPRGSDAQMYAGTIQQLSDQVARRFIEHPGDE
jgi:hypothetical protein